MKLRWVTAAAVLGTAFASIHPGASQAASHREAPLIAQDPTADLTDVYAFVSYDPTNLARSPGDRRVTLIMNVLPGQDPADGPNYFAFADDVTYTLHIDNNGDGKADDIDYEFRFKTENRPLNGALHTPLAYVGGKITGGIKALDGTGSEGLIRRQTYTVTEVRGLQRKKLFQGRTLVAVPSNAGPSTIPNYEDLASQGIYQDGNIRVFAGQRYATFYIDLGAVFDTVNLRRKPLPLLSAAEDANDNADPFGNNRSSGFDISTMAIELPISAITSDKAGPDRTANPVIGIYASTSRQQIRFSRKADTQVSRLANPLVNELIIDTPFKDRWN